MPPARKNRITCTRFWRGPAAGILLLLTSPALSQQVGETRFQQLWSEAESLGSENQYAAAAQRYRAILAEFPKSQRAALRIAVNEEKAGNTAEALRAYDAAMMFTALSVCSPPGALR